MYRFLAIIAIVLMTGCGRVKSEVTSFHEMPPSSTETFIMMPMKEQDNNLEWRQYASLVAEKLIKYGWKQVETNVKADRAVFLVYDIKGRTILRDEPVIGQIGGGTSTYSGTTFGSNGPRTTYGTIYTQPTYGVVGARTVGKDVYGRRLLMTIYDTNKRGDVFPLVYEAEVISEGSSRTLASVMPYMIESVFQDFPGVSGSTRTVVMDVKK